MHELPASDFGVWRGLPIGLPQYQQTYRRDANAEDPSQQMRRRRGQTRFARQVVLRPPRSAQLLPQGSADQHVYGYSQQKEDANSRAAQVRTGGIRMNHTEQRKEQRC